ncbi:MAG: galactokinase [Sporocytophaga sp.]|uniref:galactokinase n=1 Tax=Sporocytophaga sp. TaxID=2231183 RepID=UPI001B054ED5|nr:galactokinase [Sporocytophaga sp.]MBO9703310.1 galactokinase [Sporocytophaga sp.]
MNELNDFLEESKVRFHSSFGYKPAFIAAAPGRINIIGEHTDYNEGLSMPAAINRWIVVSGSKRNDRRFVFRSRDYDGEFSFKFGEVLQPITSWHKYLYGAINIFFEKSSAEFGADIFLMGNIPVGSGVSSSAGLLTAIFNFFRVIYRMEDDNTLVKYCQQTEHRYLGVKSGILDQSASQFSKSGKLMVLDFKVPMHYYIDANLKDWVWVLADSKVKRELAGSKYSERVDETKKALLILIEKIPRIKHFRDIRIEDVPEISDEILRKRILHYVEENQRVEETVEVLKKGDFVALGDLLKKSHASLQNLYEVSCKELDYLVDLATNFEGCVGGRMMGGGFGGCTINLVKKTKLNEFKRYISERYKLQTGIDTELNVYEIVEGAFGAEIYYM